MSGTRMLVTGGARSGKSAHAERRAVELTSASGGDVVYIATAAALDDEMKERVATHRQARPQNWLTVEEPLHLARCIREHAKPGRLLLIDCVTLWLTHVLGLNEPGAEVPGAHQARLEAERDDLVGAIRECSGSIILVTNELGSGVVPMGALTRRFVDEHGRTNQRIAEACDSVVLMVSGVPLAVKSPATSGRAG
jgi:adenosylcobinamide kinase/adenosylcobinamide-phosphate guanylyltransferase